MNYIAVAHISKTLTHCRMDWAICRKTGAYCFLEKYGLPLIDQTRIFVLI